MFRLLGAHRRRVLTAVAFFTLKDIPLWLMPVITGKVIDVVVAGGPTSELWLWAAVAVAALLQNYPNHVQWTKLFMGAVRQIGADLRNGLTVAAAEPVDRLPLAGSARRSCRPRSSATSRTSR